MKRSERIVHIVTASLGTFVAALFVFGYNSVKYHNCVKHEGCELPGVTRLVSTTAGWAFLVPLAVLLSAIVWLKRDTVVTVIVAAAWIFSLAWPLLCIWAWMLPFVLL